MAEPEQICIICLEEIEQRSRQGLTLGTCACRGELDLKHYYCVADQIVTEFDKKCRQCNQHFTDSRITRGMARYGKIPSYGWTLFVWYNIDIFFVDHVLTHGIQIGEFIYMMAINLIFIAMLLFANLRLPLKKRTVLKCLNQRNRPYWRAVWPHRRPPEQFVPPDDIDVDDVGRPVDIWGKYIEAEVVKKDPNVEFIGGQIGYDADYGPEWFDANTDLEDEWYDTRTGPKKRKRIRKGKRNRRPKSMNLNQLFSSNEE